MLLRKEKLRIHSAKSEPKNQPKQFHREMFQYNPKNEIYRCPNGENLRLRCKKSDVRKMCFNKSACANCHHSADCIIGKTDYRTITRSKYADICDKADLAYKENQSLYKLRQQTVEHPFDEKSNKNIYQ